jgi:predicted metal-dependent phosphoesterase TrpH
VSTRPRIDLHTHSYRSDGTDSPAELVAAAASRGLDVVALTDHDTAVGWSEAQRAADLEGIVLVPGMEVSCVHRGAGVHLLAYLTDPGHAALGRELERVLDGRSSRLPATLERLRAVGIDIHVRDVRRVAGDATATGRPHVADALIALGVVRTREEAFARFLSSGRPAYVRRYAADLTTMIDLVARAGGVSVLAHPWGRGSHRVLDETALAELAAAGLAGLEADHQDHPPEARERLRGIAGDLGLVVTGSSDYHGTGKVDHELGCQTTAPEQLARLLELAGEAAERARAAGANPPPLPQVSA